MNAFTVTGYGWDGDLYCPDCINTVVESATVEVSDRHLDGRPGPVFSTDDTDYVCHCRSCGTEIFTNVTNRDGGGE
jgi:hypothetical protein